MDRLTVVTSKLQPVITAVAGVIMVPLGLVSLVSGISKGFEVVPVAIGVMVLATFGVVMALVRRGRAKSVRYFSAQGLERNDGQWLAWADLERVVDQIRPDPAQPGTKALWRTEIWFRNGQSAWLLPLRVRNFGEVRQFVRTLPCDHAEVNV